MFTGIVEEIGVVQAIRKQSNVYQFQISCHTVLADVKKGDSIAVNGVCLTVNDFQETSFTVDVMPETVSATTMNTLKIGSSVNLERAMAVNDRFGGHFVSGHVDGVGEIKAIYPDQNAICLEIEIEQNLHHYLTEKGSITVDGTSLTIFKVTEKGFVISLIPVTQEDSIIGSKKVGHKVNIEADVLMKYVERLLTKSERQDEQQMMQLLQNNGFLS